MFQEFDQPVTIDLIKEAWDVGPEAPIHALFRDRRRPRAECVVLTALRTEAIAETEEEGLRTWALQKCKPQPRSENSTGGNADMSAEGKADESIVCAGQRIRPSVAPDASVFCVESGTSPFLSPAVSFASARRFGKAIEALATEITEQRVW